MYQNHEDYELREKQRNTIEKLREQIADLKYDVLLQKNEVKHLRKLLEGKQNDRIK